MIIEPIFTDENWHDFLSDMIKIIKSFKIITMDINERKNYLSGSIVNKYGNKIEIIMPLEEDSYQLTRSLFAAYVSILKRIIKNQPLKNQIFSFSVKFSDLRIRRNNNKEYYWTNINTMNHCFIRVFTVIEGHYLQAPLLQIISARFEKEKNYPSNFFCRIMSEDMANAYKYTKKQDGRIKL